MRTNRKDNDEKKEVRVELKYCEHCGGLWLRQRGAETVYCESCLPKVADLPVPKKTPGRVTLPVRPRTVVEDYEMEIEDEEDDDLSFEAAGGAA